MPATAHKATPLHEAITHETVTLPRTAPGTGRGSDAVPEGERHLAPRYAVVLHNDPVTTFEFVVAVLRRVFGYDAARAFALTLQAHLTGKSRVWAGPFEIAEHRAEEVRACGPDPAKAAEGALPLGVSLEPVD